MILNYVKTTDIYSCAACGKNHYDIKVYYGTNEKYYTYCPNTEIKIYIVDDEDKE